MIIHINITVFCYARVCMSNFKRGQSAAFNWRAPFIFDIIGFKIQ